jgi:hypothetical protein
LVTWTVLAVFIRCFLRYALLGLPPLSGCVARVVTWTYHLTILAVIN